MSDGVPQEALVDALSRVLPPEEERAEMTDDELGQAVMDNLESAKSIIENQGYNVSKSADMDSPKDLLKSLYDDNGTTSYIDSKTAEKIERAFRQPDVEADESAPSLATFYGEEVDSAASSNRGDSFHQSGNQADDQ